MSGIFTRQAVPRAANERRLTGILQPAWPSLQQNRDNVTAANVSRNQERALASANVTPAESPAKPIFSTLSEYSSAYFEK